MAILLVVSHPRQWPIHVPGVEVVAARRYLTDPAFNNLRNTRVFNLCRSYGYQSMGYYVSLLAEARGHRPQPDVVTIQDMKSSSLTRVIADDLDRLIQRTFRQLRSEQVELSVYFGQTLNKRDRQLGARLFGLFTSPLLRAVFQWKRRAWQLQSVRPIAASEIPEDHREFVLEAAGAYFTRRQWSGVSTRAPRYHLAVLVDPTEPQRPSNERALRKFTRAARAAGVATELITRDDFGRLGEFDALFIRATTFVNHFTYRFARRAAAERMAVIDDPVSIARCTNKVYLAERLTQHRIPIPRTLIVHRGNTGRIEEELGLPCVLKQPDSAFSRGVIKVDTAGQLKQKLDQLLANSELVIAQEFIPTQFDWRIGVLAGKPLYACKYYMAGRHWQIQMRNRGGRLVTGRFETLDIEDVPPQVVRTAVRAARLIGDGLYGVDLKQIGRKVHVIEVNDNPSIDARIEDKHLKGELYQRIIDWFVARIEKLRAPTVNGDGRARTRPATRPRADGLVLDESASGDDNGAGDQEEEPSPEAADR